jgi:hypothetical protein
MIVIPKPMNYGSYDVEPFENYRVRLPSEFDAIPALVIETWIYRHWREFQEWLPLLPLEWKYELTTMPSEEILLISHVGNWPETLRYWGDDLIDGNSRKNTWLGRYMLTQGTAPAPLIIAVNAASWEHPRERRSTMREPYQIVEGHMRLAYLQALIRRGHTTLRQNHQVFLVELPPRINYS